MIKLTTIDGDSVWINPNFIIKIKETVGGTDVYFTSVGGEFNKIVKESPGEIMFIINSKGFSEMDLEIINGLREKYRFGTVHEVSGAKLNETFQHIKFLLAMLGK